MNVNTQSVNFTADQKLIDFIQRRMDKLDQFYDRVIKSDIILKVENTNEKQIVMPKDLILTAINAAKIAAQYLR